MDWVGCTAPKQKTLRREELGGAEKDLGVLVNPCIGQTVDTNIPSPIKWGKKKSKKRSVFCAVKGIYFRG